MKTLDQNQWQLLRRLAAAGCPIDWDHLPAVDAPLSIRLGGIRSRTHIFPIPSGTAVILPLRVVALRPMVVSEYELSVAGVASPFTWVPRCAEHGTSCLHETPWGHLSSRLDCTLNRRTGPYWALKKGGTMDGLLMGTSTSSFTLPGAGTTCQAILTVYDGAGDGYEYVLRLECTPAPAELRDNSTHGEG